MPIYHFNLADHHRDIDAEGTELADPEEARIEAIRFAGAYLADHPQLIDDGTLFEVQVTNDDGAQMFAVTVKIRESS